MLNKFITQLFVSIINGFISVYTLTTLPIYYYIQKPWLRIKRSNETLGAQEDPLDPYSPWFRLTSDPIMKSFETESVDSMLETAMATNGEHYPIAGVKVHNENHWFYDWFSYGHVMKRIDNIAKGLSLLGVGAGDKVLIFAETRLEWILCAFAVFKLGAVVTTLFAQLGVDGIVHGINQTRVKYAITTRQQLIRLRSLLSQTPSVEKIVDMDGMSIIDGSVEIIPLKQVETNGRKSDVKLSTKTLNKREDLALIMYTSGTTGAPKGAIVTHGQLLAQAKSTLCLLSEEIPQIQKHLYIAYLPLGHMFEFMAEIMFYGIGCRLGYASPLTLIDGAPGLNRGEPSDLALLRPTIFLAVPLVLDRIRRGVTEQLTNRPFSKALFNSLLAYKDHWRSKGYTTPVCNLFLCRSARQRIGYSVQFMLVGGAPVSYETERLISLIFDVLLLQGYGGTEVCGASHARSLKDLSFGHTGPPLTGFRVKLVDWEEGGYSPRDKPSARGEIVINGDSVVSGYYLMERETNDAFRYENGVKWYYTGDIGEVNSVGCFKIIDRRKDLLKLQNGEYYSLGKIEAAVKSCPFIENICVYGQSTHDYMIALVIPNANSVKTVAKRLSLQSFSYDQLCSNSEIVSSVLKAISDYGLANGLTKREIPAKIMLCADEWTPDNGLLTAALKLKRQAIIAKYCDGVKDMFNESDY